MKKYLFYTLIIIVLASGCNTSKPKLDKVQPSISKLQPNDRQLASNTQKSKKDDNKSKTEETKSENQNSIKSIKNTDSENKNTQTKTERPNVRKKNQQSTTTQQPTAKEDKQKQKDRQKEIDKKKKENEKAKKEAQKRQKAADKEKKKKEKQQDELIKNAAKEEKKRIEEERRKEKENLLNTIKENQDKASYEEEETTVKQFVSAPIDTVEAKTESELKLEDIIGENNTDNSSIITENIPEEDNTPEFLKKFNKKKTDKTQTQPTDTIQEKEMTTMEKILFMMDEKNKIISSTDSAGGKSKVQYFTYEAKKENFIQKTWHKVFPKKIERDITYDKLYAEEPKNILILYPWNRSDYDKASDMLYIMATKELGKKGYYVYSAISGMEEYKKDSTFSSHYVKVSDLRGIRDNYSADAVMFVTVFRFDNPYWSTATKAVAHYTLVSTKTLDTLFSRQIEFNYDTPIPPKEYHNKEMELDEEQVYDLGVMEQMQVYAFQDIPFGPYHKKYKQDRKRNSQQKEVKYKINVRPS